MTGSKQGWLAIAASLIASLLIDFALTPDHFAPIAPFAITLVVATLWAPPRGTFVVSVIVLLSFLAASIYKATPLSVLGFDLVSVGIFGLLAIQFAVQRRRLGLSQERIQRQEEALRVAEERLRVALANSPIAVFNQDDALRYIWIQNPQFGLQPSDFRGKTDADLFAPETAEELTALKRGVLETGEGVRREVPVLVGDAAYVVDLTLEPLIDATGRVDGLTGSAVDITERKAAEAEREQLLQREEAARQAAEQSRSDLQRFMGLVAHDLAQPITAIHGQAQMAERGTLGKLSERQSGAWGAVDSSASRLARLASDLRDASSVATNHFSVQPGPMDLAEVLREVCVEVQAMAPSHMIVLQAPEQLTGEWDRDRMAQLATNLLTNAVKYSPEGSPVRVELSTTEHGATVRVRDQGPGITLEQQVRLFQPFSRLEGERAQGMGLGLYIAKGIAEAHHGSIRIESTPGQGSTFVVAFPCHAPEAGAVAESGDRLSEGQATSDD